jgi:hypothetical protein
MNIPSKFDNILKNDQIMLSLVTGIITSFEPILKSNKLFFFEEYTEHGIEHIEMVLKATEYLISDESFQFIHSKEVAILILSVVLHDIGMHTEFSTFKAMINGKYDDIRVNTLDKKTWYELWQDYLLEARHFSSRQKNDIFGNPDEIINEIDLSDKDNLKGTDKKLIGEFIRRYHSRFAHEVALKGFIGEYETIPFGNNILIDQDRKFAGIVARSHGINIRDTFAYLKEVAYDAWKNPGGINIIFLMVLLRIADYLQIDKSRTDPSMLKVRTFNSPVSLLEHKTHLAILHLTFENDDPELINVTCKPDNAQMYVKIETLIKDMQHEFDLSWAVLGEIYGFSPVKKPKIKFRRITSNLEHPAFLKEIDYIPKKIAFEINNELSKLLVAPLYGNDPKYGVRELVQNATDAGKERLKVEQTKGNTNYKPFVKVSVDKTDKEQYLFKIEDNGKGMTLDEILNYFLSVGSSFRQSYQWKKEFTSKDGKVLVNRNGKFGIGVLAAFLLGDEISVKTRSYNDNSVAYIFKVRLNSEYIDIEKLEKFDIGTTIEIQMSNDKYTLFERGIYYFEIYWTDWYMNKIPRVEYYFNKTIISPNIFYDKFISHNLFPKGYDRIQWGYNNDRYIGHRMFVACNDIIITLASEKNRFQYSNKKNLSQEVNNSYIIHLKPSLKIDDSNGILPLMLDRNDLDTDTLPFEDELLLDVCKDFIAQLLIMSFNTKTIENHKIEPHQTKFLFLRNGFILISDYFVNKIQSNLILLRIITNNDKIKTPSLFFNLSENIVIYAQFSTSINLTNQASNVVPKTGGCILLPKEKYDNLFKKEKRIPNRDKMNHKQKWETQDYVVYNFNDYKAKLNLLEKEVCVPIMKNLEKEIQSIQEVPFGILDKTKGGEILDGLFKKYFGNNIIIPYNMDERKKFYPLAFVELKDYMKFYENQHKNKTKESES